MLNNFIWSCVCGRFQGVRFKDSRCNKCYTNVILMHYGKIKVFFHSVFLGEFPGLMTWERQYLERQAKDFFPVAKDDYSAYNIKIIPENSAIYFFDKKIIKESQEETEKIKKVEKSKDYQPMYKKYYCPVCGVELSRAPGSGLRTVGITLFCGNVHCDAQEVAGYGRNADHAFTIIEDKFKSSKKNDKTNEIKDAEIIKDIEEAKPLDFESDAYKKIISFE